MVCVGFEPGPVGWKSQTNPRAMAPPFRSILILFNFYLTKIRFLIAQRREVGIESLGRYSVESNYINWA